jgi:GNAT superfamily N-acetyltransferase
VTWKLRPPGVADAEAMCETVAIGFEGYRDFAPPGWRPPDVRGAHELARMRARLAAPDTWARIADDGPLVAGHVGVVPQAGVPGSAHLWQLFVRPPWWGSGLATRLNGLAVDEAAGRGYGAMRLHTPAGNARSRAFYEREGWRTDGVLLAEPLLGLDLVEYRRDL